MKALQAARILLIGLMPLTACGASAADDGKGVWLERFKQVAFRKAGPRQIVYADKEFHLWFSENSRCVDWAHVSAQPYEKQLARAILSSSKRVLSETYGAEDAVSHSTGCPSPRLKFTRSQIAYLTDPAAYSVAVAAHRRDPAWTVSMVREAKGGRGCAVFLAVKDNLIRAADTFVLVPPGQAMQLADRPGTACALRGATASMGMLGHLDWSDDELLAPDWLKSAQYQAPMYPKDIGHALFWRVPLRPGMGEAEALETLRQSGFYQRVKLSDFPKG